MRRAHRSRGDGGFTLIELVIVIAILGVILVPLSDFVLSYFKTYPVTVARLNESHDAQIASAYLSQDVADTGLRASATPYAPQQSVWTATSGFPATTYCGQGLGTPVLLLEWNYWTLVSGTGSSSTYSAAYVVETDGLHRIYCTSGGASTSDATIVHNLVYPDNSNNPTPVTCQATPSGPASAAACGTAAPPTNVNFKLSIKGPADPSIWYLTLSGQRRQATS
jgi:prepilin-type N-terminal cleavage/methylation domain-containing protein